MIPMPLDDVARAVGVEVTSSMIGVRVTGVATDSRTVQPGELFVAIRGPRFDGHSFAKQAASNGASACVVASDRWDSAQDPLTCGDRVVPCLRVADTIAALGALGAHYRREVMSKHTCVIAITGSNGKTTTKKMIDHLLRDDMPGRASPASYNNHIGVPLTLLSAEEDDRYLVVEIGSNAPGEVAELGAMASPDIGIITSIGEAHLEGLMTLDAIVDEKTSLLDHVRPDGLAIVNVDRPELRRRLAAPTHARMMTFGFHTTADHRVVPSAVGLAGTTFTLNDTHRIALRLPGMHHATNATAAWLVGRSFDIDPQRMIGRLESFLPGSGRARVVEVGGVTLIDDAYNANPASMLAVVETLRAETSRRRVFVMGDMLELGAQSALWHERVIRAAVDSGIELVIAVGERSTAAAASLSDEKTGTILKTCASADELERTLLSLLGRGDCVWIKGSRAMGLDRTVRDLEAKLGQDKKPPCPDPGAVRTRSEENRKENLCAPPLENL